MNDEISVNLIVPGEEGVLIYVPHVWDFEGSSELFQERSEKKISIETFFCVVWELIKNISVFRFSESLIRVKFPFVFKIGFHLLLHFFVKIFVTVKSNKNPNELI